MTWRLLLVFFLGSQAGILAQNYPGIPTEPKPGDKMLADYFALQTKQITDACLAEVETAEDWEKARGSYREQLFAMLGIPSGRQRTELNPKITGSQERDGVVIENVVFQSLPGLYVTANFYRPAQAPEKPLATILYVCGHSPQKALGISFGNKTAYHHHGVWFAKHGYACLMIDTIQLGEIGGTHHGTYREGRWWWNSRGYTPAGVEAWNGIRALDYLQSRPEVDAERIGMTGRSGGGAYTWWVSALDERVKVAVPVAGITSLHNHVVDGVVEGHCDCMFHVNTYRWDFPQVAALIAPRPLLIANTDKDTIFPLDGVVDVHKKTRRIYELLGAADKIGLAITEGPHKDTQPLRTVAFEWFERHLKGRAPGDEFDARAPQVLDRTTMRVFKDIPDDEIVTKIDETFVAMAPAPELPADKAEWEAMRDGWVRDLREKVFRGWPEKACELELKEVGRENIDGVIQIRYEFDSQVGVRLPLLVMIPKAGAEKITMFAVDEKGWSGMNVGGKLVQPNGRTAYVFFPPRGIGPSAWTDDPKERIQIRRRFMLLGQTLDGMRVWDIRRALAATRQIPALDSLALEASGDGEMAGNTLFAALFEDGLAELIIGNLPSSLQGSGAPDYLNVLRYVDLPTAVAMAVERSPVTVLDTRDGEWQYVSDLVRRLEWGAQRFRAVELWREPRSSEPGE